MATDIAIPLVLGILLRLFEVTSILEMGGSFAAPPRGYTSKYEQIYILY